MDNIQKSSESLIVVIDDDDATRLSTGQMIRLRKYDVKMFHSAEDALAWPKLPDVDCIITDIKMPGMDGESFLGECIRRKYPPPIIIITGYGDVMTAVRCLKIGAYDFIEKPFDDDVLLASVARAVEKSTLRRDSDNLRRCVEMLTQEEEGRFEMIGRSLVIQDLFAQIEAAAKYDVTVLIMGETGVGKELVARAIHAHSSRSQSPFVPVNAGALPEEMLESELFGHAKGAFTSADADRDGKLVTASGGIVLLDEIESISLKAQIQLLRVLEDGLVQPLGKDKPRKVDIRLIITTKVDLKNLVKEGRMREDFYHRIMVLPVFVPPLRERVDDIPLLIAHFLKKTSCRMGLPVPKLRQNTLADMMNYHWPGNVRELKHAVERMCITSPVGVLSDFIPDQHIDAGRLLSLPATTGRLRSEMEKTESRVIKEVMMLNNGETGATARDLGISRRALYERLKRYGMNKEDYKSQ